MMVNVAPAFKPPSTVVPSENVKSERIGLFIERVAPAVAPTSISAVTNKEPDDSTLRLWVKLVKVTAFPLIIPVCVSSNVLSPVVAKSLSIEYHNFKLVISAGINVPEGVSITWVSVAVFV